HVAMMRRDQVQQMQPAIFRWWHQMFPSPPVFLHLQFPPERIDQLEPDRDVPHQFAALIESHGEPVFRQMIFPKFSWSVEKNSGQEKIEIQLRIERAEGQRH